MKKILTFITLCFYTNLCYSQKALSINQLKGIWHNASDTVNYKIFNDGYLLSTWYNPQIKELPFDMTQPYRIGFVASDDTTFTLKREGTMEKDLFSINGSLYHFYYEFVDNENASLELESINPTNIFNYIKVKSLPKEYIRNLFLKGKIDNKDYLKFFLDKSFKEVSQSRVIIYSDAKKKIKMYLLKGDEVEIIEEKDEWLKIRYYGKKTIEGWIKKSDVK